MVPLMVVSPFSFGVPFLCPLKTSENRRCFMFSEGIKKHWQPWVKVDFQVVFVHEVRLLTLSRRRPLSYIKKSIDMLSKKMDWFLYDRDLRHERVKGLFSTLYLSLFWWNLTIFNNNMLIPKTEPRPVPSYRYISHIYSISWIEGPHVL